MRSWDWPEGDREGQAKLLFLRTCGWVGATHLKNGREAPLPLVFSLKSQHAVQESFKQRGALTAGSRVDQRVPATPALVLILSALSWGVLAGGTEEEQGRPERRILEPQILQDNLTFSLAEVLQVSLALPSHKEIRPPQPAPPHYQVSQGRAWLRSR